LTVPFALAAGLSSLGSSKIVIYGGAAGKVFEAIICTNLLIVHI
jgi:hypothetical protein